MEAGMLFVRAFQEAVTNDTPCHMCLQQTCM